MWVIQETRVTQLDCVSSDLEKWADIEEKKIILSNKNLALEKCLVGRIRQGKECWERRGYSQNRLVSNDTPAWHHEEQAYGKWCARTESQVLDFIAAWVKQITACLLTLVSLAVKW